MAKCICVVGQGVPVRLSDEDAFQVVVRDHDGEYCSKKLFKEWYQPSYTPYVAKLQSDGTFYPVKTLHFNAQHARRSNDHGERSVA